MKFTRERFVPELRGQIAYEHRHRYAVCLDFARDRDVLDVACGEGYGASLLTPVARSVIGVDSDETSIRDAASLHVATNLTFRKGSATELPLADDSVDLVVNFETIEHVAEPREMMMELVRVLRRDGRLLISSPNKLVYYTARDDSREYRVRELYLDEFRALLCEFFPRVQLFGQRIIGSSAIHPLYGSADVSRWLDPSTSEMSGIVALPEPDYFLALCSKDPADDLADLTSVYLDPADQTPQDVRGGGLAGLNGRLPDVTISKPGEREALVARLAEAERERDELRARLGAAAVDLELSTARVAELTRECGRIATVEFERDENRAELGVTTLERDLANARVRELEVEFEAAQGRLPDGQNERRAREENERAAVRAELRAAFEDLERAHAHRLNLEADRERIVAHVARTAREHETTREELAAALHARERDAVRIVELEVQALSLAGMLEESQGLLRRSDAAARVTAAHLLDARNEAGRLRAGWLEFEAQVAGLLAALGRSGVVTSALGAAVTRAAEALASLELTRLQLETGLSARVAAAETKAARTSATAVRLRDELTLVADALALRERRIAVLEGVLRDIARENVRALQRERSRYEVLLANLQASKFFTLRSAARKLLPTIAKRARLRRSK